MVDDHCRVACVEARDDETKETATEVLRIAVAWFVDRGVTAERVLTENGGCSRSYLRRARQHPQEHAALPAADQRQDRTPPGLWSRVGLQEVLQLRIRTTGRSASMGPRVQPPPAPLGHRQALTHHQAGQLARRHTQLPTFTRERAVRAEALSRRLHLFSRRRGD